MKKNLILIICIIVLITGCGSVKEVQQYNDTKKDNTEKVHIPDKIVTFSPAVIDFLTTYDLSPTILAADSIPKFLHNKVNGIFETNPFYNEDRNKIREMKPNYIFVSDRYKFMIEEIKGLGRIVELSPLNRDYFSGMKSNYLMLAKIFDKVKEVNYDLLKVEEERRLLFEKAEKYNLYIDLDSYFKKIGNKDHETETLESLENLAGNKTIISAGEDPTDIYGSLASYSRRIDKLLIAIDKEIKDGKRKDTGN